MKLGRTKLLHENKADENQVPPMAIPKEEEFLEAGDTNDLIIVTKLPRDADSVLLCTVITSTVVITSTAPGFEILAFDGHGQGTTAESISADSCFLQPLINFVTNLIGTQEEDSLNHIVQEQI